MHECGDDERPPPKATPEAEAGAEHGSGDEACARPLAVDLLVCLVIPLLIPLGFLFAAVALLLRLGAWRRARSHCARSYWRWSALAHLLFAYAVLVLTLLAADSALGFPLNLAQRWPSLASRWTSEDDRQFLLLLDVGTALIGALLAMSCARWYGYVDDTGAWHPPRRVQRRARLRRALRRGE